MLYHDRTDISEAIDVAKSNNSKKCLGGLSWFNDVLS